MYIGKNFVGTFAVAIIWSVVAMVAFMLGRSIGGVPAPMITTMSVAMVIALAVTYFVLHRIDRTYARQAQTRVDRILNSLDDGELDSLRDRLSGGMIGDGEYGSLDDLLMEHEVKAKRR